MLGSPTLRPEGPPSILGGGRSRRGGGRGPADRPLGYRGGRGQGRRGAHHGTWGRHQVPPAGRPELPPGVAGGRPGPGGGGRGARGARGWWKGRSSGPSARYEHGGGGSFLLGIDTTPLGSEGVVPRRIP